MYANRTFVQQIVEQIVSATNEPKRIGHVERINCRSLLLLLLLLLLLQSQLSGKPVSLGCTSSPADSNFATAANVVSLHLADGHFSTGTMVELNKAAVLSWRNLDISDVSVSGEQLSKLELGDRDIQTANEDSGVVRVVVVLNRGRLRQGWSVQLLLTRKVLGLVLRVEKARIIVGRVWLRLGCGGNSDWSSQKNVTLHFN
ncbi:hypothetical protein OGAPHI_000049 [Ogataea philodendri]|uniref:Uncharacterized protein n=1 Tax=Ogataea philodendri TaxID=1378263 RepID=A0A9P8PGI4_9ASCO|nr:uncharacterized protein OGAPHI_000049 [Ogataea philodendri]KAH3671863.1 hypothetical protein OGAPHI_000049 [Ogataea philodendri]